MQLCRPPVLRRWENQRMLSSWLLAWKYWYSVQPYVY